MMDVRDVKVGTFIRGDNDKYLCTNRDMYLGVITNISEDLKVSGRIYEDEYFVVMIIRHKNSSANCHFYNVQAKYFQVVNPDSITLTPEETEVLDIVFNTFMDTHLQKTGTIRYNVPALEVISYRGIDYLLGNKDKLFRIHGTERFVDGRVIN